MQGDVTNITRKKKKTRNKGYDTMPLDERLRGLKKWLRFTKNTKVKRASFPIGIILNGKELSERCGRQSADGHIFPPEMCVGFPEIVTFHTEEWLEVKKIRLEPYFGGHPGCEFHNKAAKWNFLCCQCSAHLYKAMWDLRRLQVSSHATYLCQTWKA